MRAIVALSQKIGPSDVPVLIAGETGAGKEVVAELIHANSPRRSRQMVCVNCAGLPAELIESELFGSSKGSFTGSLDRVGIFKHANCSTAFLDELSEMPLGLQSKLLRFIQDKKVRRVGSIGEEPVDVRIIAAINKPPMECVKERRLREDLYYRLSTVTITVPPLRDRPQDIIPLAAAYLGYYSQMLNRPIPTFDSTIAKALQGYDWPGNVRQLQNEMNRCAVLCNGTISISDLNIAPELLTGDANLQEWLTRPVGELTKMEQAEATAIVKVLCDHKWNKLTASNALGIGRQTLYNKIKTLGIKTPATDARVAERTLLHSERVKRQVDRAPAQAPPPAAEDTDEPHAEPPAQASGGLMEGGFLD